MESTKMKRLAVNQDGGLSYCSAPADKLGVGRCNHLDHAKPEESAASFASRVSEGSTNPSTGAIVKRGMLPQLGLDASDLEIHKILSRPIKSQSSPSVFEQSWYKDYPHVIDAYKDAMMALHSNDSVAVVMPTGAGKSKVMSAMVETHGADCTVLVVPRSAIGDQFNSNNPDVACITIQQILADYNGGFDNNYPHLKPKDGKNVVSLIMLDELHRYEAEKWKPAIQAFIKYCGSPKVLGASATPELRADGKSPIDDYCGGRSVCNISIEECVDRGILDMPEYHKIAYFESERVEDLLKKAADRKSYRDIAPFIEDFRKNEAGYNMLVQMEIESCIEEKIKEKAAMGSGLKIAIFWQGEAQMREEQAFIKERIASAIGNSGVSSTVKPFKITSSEGSKAQSSFFKNFKDKVPAGEIRVADSINILNEGVHVDLDMIIMMRNTDSAILYNQQLGRVMQSDNQSATPIVLDLVGEKRDFEPDFKAMEASSQRMSGNSNQRFFDRAESHREARIMAEKMFDNDLYEIPESFTVSSRVYKDGRGSRWVSFKDEMASRGMKTDETEIIKQVLDDNDNPLPMENVISMIDRKNNR